MLPSANKPSMTEFRRRPVRVAEDERVDFSAWSYAKERSEVVARPPLDLPRYRAAPPTVGNDESSVCRRLVMGHSRRPGRPRRLGAAPTAARCTISRGASPSLHLTISRLLVARDERAHDAWSGWLRETRPTPCPAATPYPSERNPLDPARSVLRFFPPLHALGLICSYISKVSTLPRRPAGGI
jgi:hypothetical protein